MVRISRSTWVALGAALAVSLASVVALHRLRAVPPVAARVAPALPALFQRLATVSFDDELLVIEDQGAYRLTRDLAVREIAWPVGLRLRHLTSIARAGQAVALASDDGALVVIDDGRAWPLDRGGGCQRPRGFSGTLRGAGDHFDAYQVNGKALEVMRIDLQPHPNLLGEARALPLAPRIPDHAIEGLHFVGGEPYLQISERGAHWLIDLDARIRRRPPGAHSMWSPSLLRCPHSGVYRSDLGLVMRMPFLDDDGEATALPAAVPFYTFAAPADAPSRLELVQVAASPTDGWALRTSYRGRSIEASADRRRIGVVSDARPRPHTIASTALTAPYAPLPVGDRYILLGPHREALLLDGRGERLAPTPADVTVRALSGHGLTTWQLMVALMLFASLSLPLVALRYRRRLDQASRASEPDRPGAAGVFVGTLHLPHGTLLTADPSGHVLFTGPTHLRVNGHLIELDPRDLTRHEAGARPLTDGDRVYVVGRIESDEAGGPMRASHRLRLTADGGRYLIGLGDDEDYARTTNTRLNAVLSGFAIAQLMASLTLLGSMLLRTIG
jgi:hypothetical protein